jgi:carnitine O-acetyltransferase
MGFVAAMDDPLVDAVTRRLRFRAAAARHAERSRRCRAGQAPEQYLAELRRIWQERGAELGLAHEPDLYRSPGWLIMREDYLSTVCAPSASIGYLGFGPSGGRGISAGCALLPERLNVYLTAPGRLAGPLAAFAAELRRAVPELTDLLSGR